MTNPPETRHASERRADRPAAKAPRPNLIARFPLTVRMTVFVGLPLLVVLIGLHAYLARSLPNREGSVTVAGISDRVTIGTRADGVPTISARTDLDAYYGLGFAHARDRLWQMEMERRRASGRLSEVLGKSYLSTDILMRTLGLQHNAARIAQSLERSDRDILDAYVAGVNAGIADSKTLPPEFLLNGFAPEPWKPEDSMATMQLRSFVLSSNFGAELQRQLLLRNLGPEKASELMPGTHREHSARPSDALEAADLTIDPGIAEYFAPKSLTGSNGWVVSGSHTRSGYPILANDPHLRLSIPSVWYLAEIEGDRLHVAGATFPGLPFVAIGRNQNIAWGVTTAMADTQDVFIEKVSLADKNLYELDGVYTPMSVTQESIAIRKEFLKPPADPYPLVIRRTNKGPLLSDVGTSIDGVAYSLRWTGDDESGGSFTSFIRLNHARNWKEFNDALSGFVTPVHNFVYADVDGNIGFLVAGHIPVRASGDGSLPSDGSATANLWRGRIPFDALPRQFNPQSGFIVTANNDSLPEGYPYHVSSDFAPPYRADRITALIRGALQKSTRLDVDAMAAIQGDTVDPLFPKLLPVIRSVKPRTNTEARLLEGLMSWNGEMRTGSREAALFTAWLHHFNRLLVEDDLGASSLTAATRTNLSRLANKLNYPLFESVLLGGHSTLCDYAESSAVESCQEIFAKSFAHAVAELSGTAGSDPNDWTWGSLHTLELEHFPYGGTRDLFSWYFSREAHSPGGNETVNVAPPNLTSDHPYGHSFGASYRQIVDMAPDASNVFSLNSGQSGNPLDRHYDDFVEPHIALRYAPIPFARDARTAQVLELIPARN